MEGIIVLRKGVYMLTFSNAKHNSERAQQCFDKGMEMVKTNLDKEGVKPVNMYVYTDCCPGDQKIRFFLTHFSCFHENNPWSREVKQTYLASRYNIPIQFFQKPGNHNKWDFDSDAGLWKSEYLRAALNKSNTDLQWITTIHENDHEKSFLLEDDSHLKVIVDFMNGDSINPGSGKWLLPSRNAVTCIRRTLDVPDAPDVPVEYLNVTRNTVWPLKGMASRYCFATFKESRIFIVS